MTKYAKQRYGV